MIVLRKDIAVENKSQYYIIPEMIKFGHTLMASRLMFFSSLFIHADCIVKFINQNS